MASEVIFRKKQKILLEKHRNWLMGEQRIAIALAKSLFYYGVIYANILSKQGAVRIG